MNRIIYIVEPDHLHRWRHRHRPVHPWVPRPSMKPATPSPRARS